MAQKIVPYAKSYCLVKVGLDYFFGFIALLLCTPLIVAIAILIALDSKGPPFFMQKRVGKNGKLFTIIKMRTLHLAHFGIMQDQNTPADYRITRVGRYLRRSKLDELPQLLNIALGHMSFIGPRPIAFEYAVLLNVSEERALIKPGLTGLTQVSGNLLLPWDKRLELDVWYVANFSFAIDIKILVATFFTVIYGDEYFLLKKSRFNWIIGVDILNND